ncbi:MAG TPA: MBL fold metallo-hydrolase [Candidatus Cloacimonadota bacterium]|nr:MBL fold metallo-hydrolase [Candidatus Cloacimonadota bacterium]HQB41420.1 MBL fold metallo-hydrolase [Candidatus Cloacimonadota bacterium]
MVNFQKINEYLTIAQSSVLRVNAVIIDCIDHICLVDTLLLPSDIKALKAFLKTLNKPLKYLINTHWHSDHSIGNKYLADSDTIIIAHHRYFYTHTDEKERIRSVYKGQENSKNSYLVDYNRIMQPHICIKDKFSFTDGLSFSLIPTPGHSSDSICIYLHELKTLIAGDTLLGSPDGYYSLPYFYWGDEQDYIESLETLKGLDLTCIIPGHSNILTSEIFDHYLSYLHCLLDYKKKLSHLNYPLEKIKVMVNADQCVDFANGRKLWKPEIHYLNLEKVFI